MPSPCGEARALPLRPAVGQTFHNPDCSMELTVLSYLQRNNLWYLVMLQRWPTSTIPGHQATTVESTLTMLGTLAFHQPPAKGA